MASLFGRFKPARVSWRDLALVGIPLLLLLLVVFWLTLKLVQPAPPRTIAISSGPEGSTFARNAERYRALLARQGVTLKILPSQGSVENLKRLADPKQKVDVGFVQGGVAREVKEVEGAGLESLGSLFYTPVYVFYRAPKPMARLSELAGKRIAVGREGSGTYLLSAALLRANGIEGKEDKARFLPLQGEDAEQALIKGEVDAAFLMGDSAAFANVRDLVRAGNVRLFEFKQTEAYVRRFRFLTKVEVPEGAFDLGRNLPAEPLTLVAPTVELIARPDLHPAISDMLIEAAQQVHGRAGIFQKAGEFPAPLEHEFPISEDAARYYKSGKTFVYKHLPFWLASLVNRVLVIIVPLAFILIPTVKFLPWLYRWRMNWRIYRRYGELMALERAAFGRTSAQERVELLRKLDEIEKRVITLRLPGSFADQVYLLRQHINFVRTRLTDPARDIPPIPVEGEAS